MEYTLAWTKELHSYNSDVVNAGLVLQLRGERLRVQDVLLRQ